MRSKLITLFVLLALLLVPTSTARAQSPGGDVVLVGDNYTVKSGDTLNGSVVVIGGNVTVEEDAKVNGDVVVIGGNLRLDSPASGNVVVIGGNAVSTAKVYGDMVAIGGQIELKETAVVSGNVVTLGGQLEREEGSQIGGDIVNNLPPAEPPAVPSIPAVPPIPSVPDAPGAPSVTVYENPLWDAAGVLGRALALGAIAMLLTLFLQPQMERVSDTIMKQPFLAGSFGLLAVVVAPLAILVMAVTIILIPVSLIVAFALPLTWLFGMIALGQEVGERFAKAINQVWAPALANGFGSFLLAAVVGLVGMIPCVGWIAPFLLGLIAVGGVVMTWFGSRAAPGGVLPPAPPPAPAVVEVPPAS